MANFYEEVKQFRKDHSINHRDMAKGCGISPTTLLKIEHGKEPGLIVRGKIEKFMKEVENGQ